METPHFSVERMSFRVHRGNDKVAGIVAYVAGKGVFVDFGSDEGFRDHAKKYFGEHSVAYEETSLKSEIKAKIGK